MIDYSVIIRTTGKADKKYRMLLKAIDQLEPQPKEIIVVLPEGNSLPEEQLGKERYYFCPKDRLDQADRPDGNKILHADSRIVKFLGDIDNEAQIMFDQHTSRFPIIAV